jgi:hypothetical protein
VRAPRPIYLLLALAACATEGSLKKRPTFDFNCAEGQLTVVDLGEWGTGPKGVTGCGKRATYVFAHGQWVLNTVDPGTPTNPTPSPAPVP